MKTYSKRVNGNSSESSKKRKRDEQSQDAQDAELPAEKPKMARRTIQDFFKPKPAVAPPSPSSSERMKYASSDPIEPKSTPPSSPPPSKMSASLSTQKSLHRGPRRLSSRPNFPTMVETATSSSDNENESSASKPAPDKPSSRDPAPKRAPLKPTAANLQQVQLDLGISAMKHCKACGMDYNSTLSTDRKLHDDYHKRKVKPCQPARSLSFPSKSSTVNGETHEIRTLDCRGPNSSRVHFEEALESMYTDLPGDKISKDDLWSEIPNPIKSSIENKVPRFMIFMLLIDLVPAAILIAERISKGGGYLDDYVSSSPPSSQSNFTNLSSAQPRATKSDTDRFKAYGPPDITKTALMSVERIWVSEPHRRKGLATELINRARKTLIPGLEIKRKEVAFSWPTALGRGLATRFSLGVFDEAIPFLVNLADCPGV